MNRKHDWDAIELQYITGDMSLRELARLNGIENHSLVMAQSKRKDWAKRREEYRAKASSRAVAKIASHEGDRIAREMQVRDNAIEAIDEAINKLRSDMQATTKRFRDGQWVEEPLIVMKPQDIALLIDRLQVLFNRPSQITEERTLGINLSAGGANPELLRSIVEATRGIPDAGRAASSPIPRIGPAREN